VQIHSKESKSLNWFQDQEYTLKNIVQLELVYY
jgi:hypothetical protein